MAKHALLVVIAAIAGRTAAGRRPDVSQWKPPTPTEAREPHDRASLQISPRPTVAPFVRNDVGELRRRQTSETSIGSNTCGFWTDDGLAMSCDPAYTCTNQGQYRGCCVGSECATSSFPTVCYGATEIQCKNPGPETMCCTNDVNYPYCVTYLWATPATPNQVFSLFNCDTHDWAGQQILSAEPFAVTTTGTSSAPSGQATVPANDNNNNNNDTSNTNSGGGSGTPVGAIVGGVIGGLAVIGIFILCLVYLLLRYRRQKAAKSHQLDPHHHGADEAAPLSGPTSPAYGLPPPAIKAEEYGTTPSSMTQSTATYPTPSTVSQYTTLLHPEAEGGETERGREEEGKKMLFGGSELGGMGRSELGEDRRSELGEDRRAELPT